MTDIETAAQAEEALRPIAGSLAKTIIALGPLLHFEHPERLIDVVVANEYLQRTCPLVRGASDSERRCAIGI